MSLTVFLDAVVAVLLVVTIVYAMLLSRRLGALRNDKQQLEALVRSLDDSVRRAEGGIAALGTAADEMGRQLQQRLDRAESLKADLGYIIDLGGNLADRLEGVIRAKREGAKQPAAATGDAALADAPGKPRRRDSAAAPAPNGLPSADDEGARQGDDAPSRVAGFPSRAERLLRRALETRR
ncbi:MAG TPA: DUF6468 domain-containing protein [Stellaceae bacterium]|nr:DUF6468 domain-containing protein [Stellaceae bacterium]